jgi:hypothetical protein
MIFLFAGEILLDPFQQWVGQNWLLLFVAFFVAGFGLAAALFYPWVKLGYQVRREAKSKMKA